MIAAETLHEALADESAHCSRGTWSVGQCMEVGSLLPTRRVLVGSAVPLSVQCDAASMAEIHDTPRTPRVVLRGLAMRPDLRGSGGIVESGCHEDGDLRVRIEATGEVVGVSSSEVIYRHEPRITPDVQRIVRARRFAKGRDETGAVMYSSYIEAPGQFRQSAAMASILSTLDTGQVPQLPAKVAGRVGGLKPQMVWSVPNQPHHSTRVSPPSNVAPDKPWINHLCTDERPLGTDGPTMKHHDGSSICPLVVMPDEPGQEATILELPSDEVIRGCLRCTLSMTIQEDHEDSEAPDKIACEPEEAGRVGTMSPQRDAAGDNLLWSTDRDLHMTVVDAGASVTAIRMDTVRRYTHRPAIQPLAGNVRFRTAKSGAGSALHCHGTVNICLHVGDHPILTTAYIFENLAEPMLLGCNTLYEHGLVIDAANMAVYRGKKVEVLPSDAVPMYF